LQVGSRGLWAVAERIQRLAALGTGRAPPPARVDQEPRRLRYQQHAHGRW
jgi:hypothetical protein